jgi:hypothetical protein
MSDDSAADGQPPRKKRKRNQKQKQTMHMPAHIAEAGYRYLSVVLVGGGLALCGVTASGIFNFIPIWLIFAWLLASAGAWVVGARRRIGYVQEHGNNNQLLQVRAEFWGTVAYAISLTVSFILLFILYWYLMPIIGSSPGAGAIAAVVTIAFFLAAYWLSHKNRQRVYENFGYDPDDAVILQQATSDEDSTHLQESAAGSDDAETEAFVQGLDKLDKSSNAN